MAVDEAKLQALANEFVEQAGDVGLSLVENFYQRVQQRMADPALSQASRDRLMQLADEKLEELLTSGDPERLLAIEVLQGGPNDPLTSAERFLSETVKDEYRADPPPAPQSIEMPDGTVLTGDEAEEFAESVLHGLKVWPMAFGLKDPATEVIDGLTIEEHLRAMEVPKARTQTFAQARASGWEGDDGDDYS